MTYAREIYLPNGSVAYVDDADYPLIKKYEWKTQAHGGVVTHIGAGELHSEYLFMHHLILPKREGLVVDHINRNKQDNRRINLRYATIQQNAANMRRREGYKGVTPQRGKWKAQIMVDGKCRYLGLHPSPEEAAKAYDKAAKEAWGEYACCNFGQAEVPPPVVIK